MWSPSPGAMHATQGARTPSHAHHGEGYPIAAALSMGVARPRGRRIPLRIPHSTSINFAHPVCIKTLAAKHADGVKKSSWTRGPGLRASESHSIPANYARVHGGRELDGKR